MKKITLITLLLIIFLVGCTASEETTEEVSVEEEVVEQPVKMGVPDLAVKDISWNPTPIAIAPVAKENAVSGIPSRLSAVITTRSKIEKNAIRFNI